MTEALIETRHRYAQQVSDLGGETDEDAATTGSLDPALGDDNDNLPFSDADDDDNDDHNDDDALFGVQVSVETHLMKQANNKIIRMNDSFEDEASIRSWKSIKSWTARGRNKLLPSSLRPTSPPKVEVYVDVREPLPRVTPKATSNSNAAATAAARTTTWNAAATKNTTARQVSPPPPEMSGPCSDQDLGTLLALVPSVEQGTTVVETPDALSIQSQTVFTRDDFVKTHWLSALTTNSGYLGLAVIAVTISIAHPLLFLAAAAAALGTATAVGASYDYFVDCAPCCSPDPTLTNNMEESIVVAQPAAATVVPPAAAVTVPASTTALATTTTPVAVPSPPLSTATTATPQILPSDWLEANYPALDFNVVKGQMLEGLNVVQFFDVFFSDTAPYNFKEFQIQRGDKQVEYGAWKPMVDESTPFHAFPSLSLHPAAVPYPAALEHQKWLHRELHFLAKTNNTILGPPYATTTKQQRILIVSKKLAVLEMKTTLADIPFCDRFYVLERWLLEADKDSDGVYHLEINSSASIVFVRSCPFASQIQTKSRSSLKDVGTSWCHMATQALKLTKQAKEHRIQQEDKQTSEETCQLATQPKEEAPPKLDVSVSKDKISSYTEEKKDDDHSPHTHMENIELMHDFKRQTSWVAGEHQPEESISQRSRSLRRFLPGRRGASVGPKPASPHRLCHENSAVF